MSHQLTLIQSSVSLQQRSSKGQLLSFIVDKNLFWYCHFRFILHAKKTAFVVEHDFIMATYLADRVVVFEGTPSIKTIANT